MLATLEGPELGFLHSCVGSSLPPKAPTLGDPKLLASEGICTHVHLPHTHIQTSLTIKSEPGGSGTYL